MTRVAAIDIGTNSTRLLVADIEAGRIADVVRRSTVTRLGEGVDAGRTLQPEPMARTRRVLEGYVDEARELGAVRAVAVATSAARDASNGPAYLAELGEALGVDARVVTGLEEAALTRRGVGASDPRTLVLDVGGGSTELILPGFAQSIDVGSVRLTERFLHDDPPSRAQIDEAAAYVRELLPELDVTAAVGVAGTVTQLHAIAGELSADTVARELDRLGSMPLVERAEIPGMDPARAPVIVGGTIVVSEVLRRYALPGLGWSERDILDGLALEAAGDADD